MNTLEVGKELEAELGITDEAYSEYISQLLTEDSMETEEKLEVIKEFLEEATSKDVTEFVEKLLRNAELLKLKAIDLSDAPSAQAPNIEAELEALKETTLSEPKKKVLTKEERRKRDQLLAKYGYDVDEIVEGADGEAEFVYRGDTSVPELSIGGNDNAARVRDVEQQRRAKMKSEHEQTVLRNKAALEKQLADKEKEKRRTQKKEKRRM
ncbi:hypothetical protein BC829DRAFT_91315 [Chytridium lagenaria]|nr:hypothetical protein BC829DRAFT_91315 [Chytridium lagenaria]